MIRGPTERQRRAVLDTLANAGRAKPKNRKRILLDAGYSPAIAKNPEAVETSKGWKELMDEYLPDQKLAQVHKDGLEATKGEAIVGGHADCQQPWHPPPVANVRAFASSDQHTVNTSMYTSSVALCSPASQTCCAMERDAISDH